MQTNTLPPYDLTDNPTGCCPRFQHEAWDRQDLHFEDKLFVRATTKSKNHVPIDMDEVFSKTYEAISAAGAVNDDDVIVLSRDLSDSEAEHLFSVSKEVPGQEMVRLSGDYVTRVFEGSFQEQLNWYGEMQAELSAREADKDAIYFFYTTCPKCAEIYGKNYVVGVGQVH